MKQTYVNQTDERRVWPTIQIPTTGQTLELGPGETAYLDLPDGFTDFALVPFAATGGVVSPSVAYIVGESGPETQVPTLAANTGTTPETTTVEEPSDA